MKRTIIVLGMHRSGTSLITKALQTTGVYLGHNLLGSARDNPKGFWEDKEIININSALLKLEGGDWSMLFHNFELPLTDPCINKISKAAQNYIHKQFGGRNLWAFKDPRTCLLLPFWKKLLKKNDNVIRFLIVLRNPLSVIDSLWERDRIIRNDVALLYIEYILPIINLIIQKEIYHIIDYDDFLDNAFFEYSQLAQHLELKVDYKTASNFWNTYLSTKLRHYQNKQPVNSDSEMVYLAYHLYFVLKQKNINTKNLEAIYKEAKWKYQEFVKENRKVQRKVNFGKPLINRYGSFLLTFIRHLKYLDISPKMIKYLISNFEKDTFKNFINLHAHTCEKFQNVPFE